MSLHSIVILALTAELIKSLCQLQWRIQLLLWGGAETLKLGGFRALRAPAFNCSNLNQKWPVGGGGARPLRPPHQIRPHVWFHVKYKKEAISVTFYLIIYEVSTGGNPYSNHKYAQNGKLGALLMKNKNQGSSFLYDFSWKITLNCSDEKEIIKLSICKKEFSCLCIPLSPVRNSTLTGFLDYKFPD